MIDRKELVEKMLDAQFGEHWPSWKMTCDEEQAELRKNMDAALTVAIEELLKEPVSSEIAASGHCAGECCAPSLRTMFSNRRAQLERVETPEERVTVTEGGTYPHANWIVMRDSENVLHMLKSSYSREDAEIYRLGLIQQLKGSA